MRSVRGIEATLGEVKDMLSKEMGLVLHAKQEVSTEEKEVPVVSKDSVKHDSKHYNVKPDSVQDNQCT
ncbi:unnamed protein product [Cuscuta europaea]|uniref:Uncharacterized protein n=1 Tax=Cuscuta europaea TaxID=41803 RepID=A0A9P0ZTF1_CUSEU|nr:unnamed protein product [Cuscuta europaea]